MPAQQLGGRALRDVPFPKFTVPTHACALLSSKFSPVTKSHCVQLSQALNPAVLPLEEQWEGHGVREAPTSAVGTSGCS